MERGHVLKSYASDKSVTQNSVSEKQIWNKANLFLAFWAGVVVVVLAFVGIGAFNFDKQEAVIFSLSLALFYAVVLFFLLEPTKLRIINKTQIKEIEKPVERIRVVEKPIVKYVDKPFETIKYIDRPVEKEITKTIMVESPKVKLDIPKYDYLGSSETKTFHKKSCRLGKLIKRKYKVSSNSKYYFIARGYKPCKVCLKKDSKKRDKTVGKKQLKKERRKPVKKNKKK